MKMMSSTSMTSMNGVTLISCVSPNSSSSRSLSEAPMALLRGARKHAAVLAIEIARQQTADRAGGAADEFEIAPRAAREVIVEDHRRDRRHQSDRGREQRFGDAGRDDSKVGGLRL